MEKWQRNIKKWVNLPSLKQLEKKFPKADIFLVGGALRDAVLGRETKDFDFVVRNVSKKELEKFLGRQGKVNLVGKKFGVFKFRPKGWVGEDIDIALPRTEHSLNLSGAYKDFKIKSNASLKIEDDLSRRDFTINAMAFDVINNRLIDPFDGLKDIKKSIIRAVGQPNLRFKEDYSRMLRAIRFACQLGFKIEPKTWQAIKSQIKNLDKKINGLRVVPYEVIAKELVRAVKANPLTALELLTESQATKILMPELLKMKGCPQPKNFHSEGDVWRHTVLALNNLKSKKFKREFVKKEIPAEVIWALLFHDIGKPATIIKADRIRFNNHDVVSGKVFKALAEKLKLSSGGLNTDQVEKLINKHMLAVHSQVTAMKDITLEKYFFNQDFPGQELMMVIFADITATVPPSGRPDLSDYQILKKRISQLAKKTRGKKELPKPLVNGHDLIKNLGLTPSPKIGKLLELLREAQLKGKIKNKKEGLNYLKKINRQLTV